MKKFLLMAISLSALSCSGQDGNLPDKKTMSIIKKAEKVVYYALDPMETNCTSQKIEGICTTGFSKILEQNEIDTLISIINGNAKIPIKEGSGKFSAFIPVDVFQFTKGNDTVNFLVDLHCYKWKFSSCDKKNDFDAFGIQMKKLVYDIIGEPLVATNHDLENTQIKGNKQSILSEPIQNVLHHTDSLIWYILDPMQHNETNGFHGLHVLDTQKESDTVIVNDLKKILLDKDSFIQTDMVKNCAFLPDLGFRIFGSDTYIDLLFAFYCNECRIIFDNNTLQYDSENIRRPILQQAKMAFPKDRYIRILLNK